MPPLLTDTSTAGSLGPLSSCTGYPRPATPHAHSRFRLLEVPTLQPRCQWAAIAPLPGACGSTGLARCLPGPPRQHPRSRRWSRRTGRSASSGASACSTLSSTTPGTSRRCRCSTAARVLAQRCQPLMSACELAWGRPQRDAAEYKTYSFEAHSSTGVHDKSTASAVACLLQESVASMLETHKKDMQRVSVKAARSVEQAANRDSKDQLERVRPACCLLPAQHHHALPSSFTAACNHESPNACLPIMSGTLVSHRAPFG